MSIKALQIFTFTTLLFILGNAALSSEIDHTSVFFPFSHIEYRPDVHTENADLDEFEWEIGTDFIHLLNYKKMRFLGEFVASNHKVEMERLQFGFNINEENTLWMGRYHAPLGYWNSNYHHGLHLQTSVHRPGIIEYEEDAGVLANHITGFLFEGQNSGDGLLKYAIATGFSPTLKDELIAPTAFGDINSNLHHIAKVSYQFDELSPTEYGAVVSHSTMDIEKDGNSVASVSQYFAGLYTHQSLRRARITTSAYFVNNDFSSYIANDYTSKFMAGYIHLEYDLASKWIVYGRIERTLGGRHDPYLDIFEHNETQRNLGGLRFDITRRHAISTEVSNRVADHESHTHISLQWSAVYP